MERYLRRNRLSETLDALGMAALLYALAVLWFTWLWGLNGASLLAGAALGTLLWTGRQEWRRRTVARREKVLRSRLGAELMLEEMLMAEPKEAHFRAALLLAEKWIPALQKLPSFLRHGYVLLAVCLSFVLFNAQSMTQAGSDLAAMFGFGGLPLTGPETVY